MRKLPPHLMRADLIRDPDYKSPGRLAYSEPEPETQVPGLEPEEETQVPEIEPEPQVLELVPAPEAGVLELVPAPEAGVLELVPATQAGSPGEEVQVGVVDPDDTPEDPNKPAHLWKRGQSGNPKGSSKWVKGVSGNPAGSAPRKTIYRGVHLIRALEVYARRHHKPMPLQFLASLFYSDDKMRIALLNKIFADKVELGGEEGNPISHTIEVTFVRPSGDQG